DERVNAVTKRLFERYNTPEAMAGIPLGELEELIRPTGFYKNKARALKALSMVILERFGGEVPSTMEELLSLPGVGRKTANVVLGAVFDVPGIVVDTHVKRLSARLGLSDSKDPDTIEKDLERLLPPERWRRFSDLLIYHGRAVCKARNPDHLNCPIGKLCPSSGI
ncbi:MAG: endonuclease III domain-containing protein, partial [Desulfatiglandales bacterium]